MATAAKGRTLTNGFAQLDLMPTGRLRRLRREMAAKNRVAMAWSDTGRALHSALQEMEKTDRR